MHGGPEALQSRCSAHHLPRWGSRRHKQTPGKAQAVSRASCVRQWTSPVMVWPRRWVGIRQHTPHPQEMLPRAGYLRYILSIPRPHTLRVAQRQKGKRTRWTRQTNAAHLGLGPFIFQGCLKLVTISFLCIGIM